MTKFRKVLLGVAVAAAVTVPVGVAYAADGPGTGSGHGPATGMMTGHMNPADCQKNHAEHHAQMQNHRGDMGAMHDQMGRRHGVTGNGTATTPGT